MKVLNLFLGMLFLTAKICQGQDQPRVDAGIDFGAGFNANAWSPNILYYEDVNFHKAQWFKLGVGLRFSGLYEGQTSLRSENSGVVADVLNYQKLSANSLSFAVGASIRVWRIDIGANTDLIGLVYGSSRSAFYPKSVVSPAGQGALFYNKYVSTSPTALNALPVLFRRQSGQSDLFVRIGINRYLGVKLGYTFGRITYATKKVDGEPVILDNGQQRFSKTYGMPYAALSVNIAR